MDGQLQALLQLHMHPHLKCNCYVTFIGCTCQLDSSFCSSSLLLSVGQQPSLRMPLHLLQAFDRVSGCTVALKLYHMHKLNSISSHQVAREVSVFVSESCIHGSDLKDLKQQDIAAA
jgi:hypothetical protein